MSLHPCVNCGKENACTNYCDWDCHVAYAEKLGGVKHQPNGLPIRCIKHDGMMYEHEHGDHPDYKFPVVVEYVGRLDGDITRYHGTFKRIPTDQEMRDSMRETHALIYDDGFVAVTLYECCYALWSLREGKCLGGNLWKGGEWKLSSDSLNKIRGA